MGIIGLYLDYARNQLVCREVMGQVQVLYDSRVTARKACIKRSAAISAGSSFSHQMLRKVLIPRKLWPVAVF